jgi:hypothetical protein
VSGNTAPAITRWFIRAKELFWCLRLALIILVSLTSSIGLLFQNFYTAETDNWKIQSIGQDAVDLFLVVPVMIITAWAQLRGNRTAMLIWPGILLYIIYTFVIFCFDVHFNRLFIFYCLIVGISFYSLLYFLYQQVFFTLQLSFVKSAWTKIVAIYLLVVAISFYFLWLAEIIPSIVSGTLPRSL